MLNQSDMAVRLGIALAALVALIAAYIQGRSDGADKVQAEWSAERLETAAAVQAAAAKTRAVEAQANKRIERIQEQTNESLSLADRRHRAAIERLRQQQSASGSGDLSGGAAAVVASCTEPSVAGGDERVVVRPDSIDLDFPIDYARDAAMMQAALDSCVSQYRSVQQMMEAAR